MSSATRISTLLRANGLFSALSGLFALVAAPPLTRLLAPATALSLRILGAVLLVHAVDLFLTARRDPPARAKVWYFTTMDAAWVIGTGVLLARVPFSGSAVVLLVAIAVVVGAFGVLQLRELRSGRTEETVASLT